MKDANGVEVEVGDRVHFSRSNMNHTKHERSTYDTYGKVITIDDTGTPICWIWIEGTALSKYSDGWSKFGYNLEKA